MPAQRARCICRDVCASNNRCRRVWLDSRHTEDIKTNVNPAVAAIQTMGQVKP